jgi:hypothetical protein
MNLHMLKRDTDPSAARYVDLFSSLGFFVTNDAITHDASGSLLDHVCSNFLHIKDVENTTFGVPASDHNAILSTISLNETVANRSESVQLSNNPNCALTKAIQKTISKRSFIKTFKVKSDSTICEYFTEEILSLIEEKDKVYRRMKTIMKKLRNRGVTNLSNYPSYRTREEDFKEISLRLCKAKS